jgi:S-methylmethionine-dependent homocysteine/selenocysteine methylase
MEHDINKLQARLDRGEVIILDGATGTELEKRGAPMDRTAWSAAALLTHPDIVRQVHEDYIRAGADIIITNTFGTARHVLEPAGLGDRFRQLNSQAVVLAQEARERVADRAIFIAGSISTFNANNDASYKPSAAQARANYRDQAEILVEAGVDLIMLEMMLDVEQTTYAVEAALAAGCPVWVGFSCKIGDDKSVSSLDHRYSLASVLEAVLPLGGSLMSIMHTLTEDTAPALQVLMEHWRGPVGAYAHSGTFTMPNWHFIDVISPEDYLAAAQTWVEMGAQVIGGCCGTGPEHIRLLKERLPTRAPARRVR